jgi:hypothetical protein
VAVPTDSTVATRAMVKRLSFIVAFPSRCYCG